MKVHLQKYCSDASSLDDVLQGAIQAIENIQASGTGRLGYVAGIISSDGPECVEENMVRLRGYTERLREEHGFPMISAAYVFQSELFQRIMQSPPATEEWIAFWRQILSCGRVTDLFMTPRWEESYGSRDEHELGKKLGIRIYYI